MYQLINNDTNKSVKSCMESRIEQNISPEIKIFQIEEKRLEYKLFTLLFRTIIWASNAKNKDVPKLETFQIMTLQLLWVNVMSSAYRLPLH